LGSWKCGIGVKAPKKPTSFVDAPGADGRIKGRVPARQVIFAVFLEKAHIVCAFHDDELRHHRRDDFGLRQVFTMQRQVEHLALRFVEKPLAWCIERGAVVFHPEALIWLELDKGIPRTAFDLHGERFIV